MRKPRLKPWHELWAIILALIVFFPLGLLLLWTSPRPTRSKVNATLVFCVLAVATAGLAHATGLDRKVYHKLVPRDLSSDAEYYDIRLDPQGNYVTPQILKGERRIFSAVVRELRKNNPLAHDAPRIGEETPLASVVPEQEAFQAVADEHGLPVEDVEAIYLKVSHQLERVKK